MEQNAADDKYPEILAELRDDVLDLLVSAGIEKQLAEDVAIAAAERTREKWGGCSLYIPKAAHIELRPLYYEIYRKFNGQNVQQLMREYNMTKQWLYRIFARVRKELIAKHQLNLFTQNKEGGKE